MKRILITFSLVLTGLALFGQIPRIRLNQVQKDTVWGSVLISSPVDSNLTYSRDFYIGADTSLNFYGTILVAGGGGGGSFVTTAILSDSLSNYILKLAGFGGDVTGTYDNIVVVDDSHNHVISNVDGLQTALDGKSNTGHTHVIGDISGLQTALDGKLSSVNIGVGLSGSGTTGSPLVVDTAVYIVSKNFYFANLPAGGGGTVTSVAVDAGTGISISGSPITTSGTITVTNAAPDQTVSITGAGINAVTGTYPNFTITGTEVDGSVTNEGSLSVGAGGDNSSTINSNTSGSTNVTIAGGSNVTVTESGSTITIASTGGGGSSFNNLTEDGDTIIVAKHLEVDTTTLFVDAFTNKVGIGTTTPSQALDVNGNVKIGDSIIIENTIPKMGIGTFTPGSGINLDTKLHIVGKGAAAVGRTTFLIDNLDSTSAAVMRIRNNIGGALSAQVSGPLYSIPNSAAFSASGGLSILFNTDGDIGSGGTNKIFFRAGGFAVANQMAIEPSGKVGIGTDTPTDELHNYRASGSVFTRTESGSIANGESAAFSAEANSRLATIGVYKHSGITNNCGFLYVTAEDNEDRYIWSDNSGNLRISATVTHIGTTSGTVVGAQTSDKRLKYDLGEFQYGINQVMALNPVRYTYIDDQDQTPKIGFYAQDVMSVIPESVFDTKEVIKEGESTKLGMDYSALIPVLTKAIQEQQAIIESQKTEIDNLKTQYESLLQRIITLENK